MNRETIEKAAEKYSYKQWKAEKDFECRDCMDIIAPPAFVAGAEWRINSVWHDASEKPEFGGEAGRWIVMYFEHGMLSTTFARKDEWHELRKHNNFTRWAYQTDLMPDRKEEER